VGFSDTTARMIAIPWGFSIGQTGRNWPPGRLETVINLPSTIDSGRGFERERLVTTVTKVRRVLIAIDV
jgi:hypothetical protein